MNKTNSENNVIIQLPIYICYYLGLGYINVIVNDFGKFRNEGKNVKIFSKHVSKLKN